MLKIDLKEYGWDDFFEKSKKSSKNKDLEYGRVVSVHRSIYDVITIHGEVQCKILGNIQFKKEPLSQPAVGDWVLLKKEKDSFVIHEVLDRKSIITRQKKHDRFQKPIAANIDRAIIIQSVGQDFNIKRLDRILIHIHEAEIVPIIVINKIDLASKDDLSLFRKGLENLNKKIKVIFTSYKTKEGIVSLEKELVSRETVIFIGSSGVGKSSLINYLARKDYQKTQDIISRTGKGKHTTTARRLIRLDNGVLVIDTPGTREFGMHYNDDLSLKKNFDFIEEISKECNFSNCSHYNEPGCAVVTALKSGKITADEYERYINLQKELGKTAKQMRQKESRSSRKVRNNPLRSIRRGKNKK